MSDFEPFPETKGPEGSPDRLAYNEIQSLRHPPYLYWHMFSGYQSRATSFGKRHASVTEALCCEALGLSGEVGEINDHLKKHLGHSQSLDIEKLARELGDVLWYVQKMCSTLGLSLAEVAALNIQKLSERHPTGKFDPSYHATGETESEREKAVEGCPYCFMFPCVCAPVEEE